MSDRPRFVLDTNVLVAALCFRQSFGRRAFDMVMQQGTMVSSLETMAELKDVLSRPRLQRLVRADEVRTFMTFLSSVVMPVMPSQKLAICRDSKDDKFLELALEASAATILTRDADLLVLNPFRSTEVIEPETFVRRQTTR
jgi:uncharacterized protein